MFHDLKIHDVQRETPDAVTISFDLPEGADKAFGWVPGQYLTLRAEVNGEDIRRSYSIASAPGQRLCVGVKQVDGGMFSTFAQSLEAGQVVQVMPPSGRFVTNGEESLILIAAGSGVTPMMSIAADALARGANVTLIYGNRDLAHIMFRSELDALKDRFMGQFTLIHVLSREEQDVDLLNGRITGDRVIRLAQSGAVDLVATDGVFLCGPGDMIDDVTTALASAGVEKEKIHFERFTQDGETPRAPRSETAAKVAEEGAAVSVILDGAKRSFVHGAQDDTILDAAERAGHELPYSCRGGMCCTCRCKVTRGKVEMAVNFSLEQWELDAGFVLGCQARPLTDDVELDFDAA